MVKREVWDSFFLRIILRATVRNQEAPYSLPNRAPLNPALNPTPGSALTPRCHRDGGSWALVGGVKKTAWPCVFTVPQHTCKVASHCVVIIIIIMITAQQVLYGFASVTWLFGADLWLYCITIDNTQ